MSEFKILANIDHQIGTKRLLAEFRTEASIAVVRGATGIGKSMLLKILAGVIASPKSTVSFGNRVIQSSTEVVPAWQREVGWMPQNHLLFPHLTVRKNLLFGRPGPCVELDEVCQRLQIKNLLERNPRNLSGGESQRVALGRAMLSQSSLLLLDEPFAALDEGTRNQTRDFVYEWIQQRGVTAVIITHQDSDVDGWDHDSWLMTEAGLQKN